MDNSIKNEDVEFLINVIKDIVQDVVSQMNLRIERYYDGIVTSVNSEKNTVCVDGYDTTFDDIPNKTGVSLNKKDGVRIYSASPTLSDAYVGVRISEAPIETQETEE